MQDPNLEAQYSNEARDTTSLSTRDLTTELYVTLESDQQQNGDPDPHIESNVAQTNLDLDKQPSEPEVAHSSTTSVTSEHYTTYDPNHIERNLAPN